MIDKGGLSFGHRFLQRRGAIPGCRMLYMIGYRHDPYPNGFSQALDLDRPVAMGCSIGGRIIVKLAIDYASEFRALIGLEASDYQAPWGDHHWATHNPYIHGGEVCAGLASGMMAPHSPEEFG